MGNVSNFIDDSFSKSRELNELTYVKLSADVKAVSRTLVSALRNGRKVLICGNGGSASDANHFAAELVCKFRKERRALPAISLTANPSTMTAIPNDYDFERVFSRQVEAFGKKGDVFIGITTSGNSKNVIEAARKATSLGLKTISFTGNKGGKIKGFCDLSLIVPSSDTARIQEMHILIIHTLCDIIEAGF
ncbi:phosphoheptose isomerase [candidate division WWE3 bacterium RIFCSPHIGHO2_01_FULL_40_23]|uniref:Phosphoheptose isomerase n=1 Tax=candidate division WWE3 bacterium RIFCSPLOWO2_01_FULL_41_18 TaxID=1802625 RepID=A0A1F4VCL1_UNCKA|nr:MAG: phosphoheptose isomerase [candidate division WWE3 bacterium RIFCSPHIGHO2_01_FULL_40_23]OGC54976.1 MAG: phosphoheptose isomerase [candidate division WWE3 bacterium RIFCSPLOWO2_01_FULL_41_18]